MAEFLMKVILFRKEQEDGTEAYEWWWQKGKKPSGIVVQERRDKRGWMLMFIERGALVGEVKDFKRLSEVLDYLRIKHHIDARIHV